MQLSEYRTKVRRRAGISVSDDLLTDEINSALTEIAAERTWPWLELSITIDLTGAGDGTIGSGTIGSGTIGDPMSDGNLDAWLLPTDWRQVRSVLHNDTTVPHIDPHDADMVRYDRGWYVEAGNNSIVFVNGDSLEGPAGVRYVAHENTLSADGDTPKLPVEWDDLVVLMASANVLEGRHEEPARAEGYRRRAARLRKRMILRGDPAQSGPRTNRVFDGVPF